MQLAFYTIALPLPFPLLIMVDIEPLSFLDRIGALPKLEHAFKEGAAHFLTYTRQTLTNVNCLIRPALP